jgi:hypothetical protein
VRTHRSTVVLGALAAGLVVTQQACTITDRPSNAPVAFTAPAPSSAGAKSPGGTVADPILAGKRQIVIRPIPGVESIVAVDGRGRLGLTDGEAERGLFVLTPVGDKYLIKTAKAEAGGEPSCLGIKNGAVAAAACDTAAGQLFTITRQKTEDPTYAISNRGAFLQVYAKSGLKAEELGDAPLRTTYAFVDNGPSTLPSLD